MKKPYTTLAVARGLTVLVMPAVHTVFMYSRPDVYHSWWAYLLRFFAEGPGAQLFMFIMGFFLAIGKTKPGNVILKRSVTLLAAGYVLNFFRTYLPASLGLLPLEMVANYGAGSGPYPYLPLLLTGDILQFAGLAYGITGWVAKHNHPVSYALVIFGFCAVGAPFLWGTRSPHIMIDHLMALFCGNDSRAFFPLFPWLCYPMAGLASGYFYIRSNQKTIFKLFSIAGIVIIITGVVIVSFTPAGWEIDFYRSSPGRTIANTGFVLMWLSLIHIWIVHTTIRHPVVRMLTFCSRQITLVYFIHWLVICWCMPLAGYQQLDRYNTLLAIVMVSIISFGLAFLFRKSKSLFSFLKNS